jgi:N-methylhydantoinase B/oxoprolinase/acetone carboxylase alpha subunit
MGAAAYASALKDLNDYGERLARAALAGVPAGLYRFEDWMEDDGQGTRDIPIRVALTVAAAGVHLDFAGTAPQVSGNINCPLSVAAAAVLYCFRCLMPPQTPACAGTFRPIALAAPPGCLLNARRPAAVAAGVNRLNGRGLPGRATLGAAVGDRLLIETPGGGVGVRNTIRPQAKANQRKSAEENAFICG